MRQRETIAQPRRCDPAQHGGRTGTETGFIAQEVEGVFPEWVGTDVKGYKTLNIGGFEALTAEALRELRQEKDNEIASLRADSEALRERLAALESMFQEHLQRER